jgi:hypothetical protein
MSTILLPIGQTLLGVLTWVLAELKRRGNPRWRRVATWALLVLILIVGVLQVIQNCRARMREGRTSEANLRLQAKTDTILSYVRPAIQSPAVGSVTPELPAGLHYDLALTYRRWKERSLAEQELRLAVRADTASAEMRATLGLVLGENGLDLEQAHRMSEAIEKWREAISLYNAALARASRLTPVDAGKVQHWLNLATAHLKEIAPS